ncbi:MAG: UDP-glucose/GDP-mannose dehydrogenase family protein [Acidimicrobiaceae bacterium]|nr:UDP-glucose/GDP-mannose dehydrogenase family protein [Acidimicrobiaceae bacterium]
MVGTGYVGTVVAACFATLDTTVIGVEAEPSKISALRSGQAPFWEPDLDELLGTALRSGRLSFTADVGEALAVSDVVFLCVGTPAAANGCPDLEALDTAARLIGRHTDGHHVVVTKSTVPIGSSQWLTSLFEEAGTELAVVSNPEFLREGSAVSDFLQPDRIVLGSDNAAALETVVELYRPIVEQKEERLRPPVIRTDLVTAETVKYAANAFLATKVSFINEIANICDLVGADVTDVAGCLGLDRRIGPGFLEAGLGWGGSCFGKDLSALVATAADCGYEASLLQATIGVNKKQRMLIVEKLQRHLKVLRGRRIAVFGLAFKAGTDDVRDSPAVDVACRLQELGALVTVCDPRASAGSAPGRVRFERDPHRAATASDAVVIATEWPEFATLDLEELASNMRGDLLVDGRNLFDPHLARAAGLRYDCVGRSGVALAAPVHL